ncbi:hypothetical protein EU557_20155 [Hymenobacter wooponensis]|uniref:Uncharacterized protein n=1 Tax=Hymenobacter wooponensis TaxID=1525360 RepID=A0A4Z0MF89_9BACT|nr:hypothetical protein EU557_20155 [Hymenobacter wooponensis]
MRRLLQSFLFLAVACLLFWLVQQGYNAATRKPESPVVLFASFESGVNGSWLQLRTDSTFDFTRASLVGDDDVTRGNYQRMDSILQLDRLPTQGMLKSRTLLIRSNSQHKPSSVWQLDKNGQVDSSLAVFTVY